MKKKLLSLFLALCMILSTAVTLGVTTFATGEGEATATVTAADFAKAVDAENPENNVIELQNKTDLKLFWQNYGNVKAGITVKLCADIAFNEGMNAMELTSTSDVSGLEVTTTANGNFSGTFDGLKKAATDTEPAECYTISGLCLKNAQFVGHLFGTVSNVNFENCFQNNTNGESGIVAYYVRNGAKVTNVTMTDCHVMVTNTAKIFVGGIAGRLASATISYCSFDGKAEYYIPSGASATTAYVGGFFGYANGEITIEHSTNRAEVVGWSEAGGFVADLDSASVTIENCVNEGTVRNTGTNKTSGSVGGFIGQGIGSNPSVTIRNCVNKGAVTAVNANMVGGIIARNPNKTTIDNTVNFGTVTYYSGTLNQVRVGGIVGDLHVGPVSITSCANFGDVVRGDNSTSLLTMAGGLIGHATEPIETMQNCLSAGDVNGVGRVSGLLGLVDHKYATQGIYENILMTGAVSIVHTGAGTHNFWGGDNFGGTSIKGCYYIADALQHKAASDTNWTTFTETNDEFFIALDSADALKGVAGMKLLSVAGYDFDEIWYLSGDQPVPTALAVTEGTLDTTTAVVYQGYQEKIVTATDPEEADTFSIRLVAGLNSLEYMRTGFEVYARTADGMVTTNEALNDNTVYTSLVAYAEDGSISDPITAEGLGCEYLSAVTVCDLPATGDAILYIVPYVINDANAVFYGSMIVLVVEDGEVVDQYAI